MHCCLFVTYQNVFETILLENGIVDVENCSAWVTENVLDAFLFQTFDNDFRAGIFHFKKS